MSPATWPRPDPLAERMLVVDAARGALADRWVGDLKEILDPGDLVVVNDSATMPARLRGTTAAGEPIELRLAGGAPDEGIWAIAFGVAPFGARTEDFPTAPRLHLGDIVRFDDELEARVIEVDPRAPRLVRLGFRERGAALWQAIYRVGKPVQYAYVAAPLELWSTQTPYASVPRSAEMPSAGRPLAWSLLLDLAKRGVRVVALTHAAGLSSTGDPELDARLPLPERWSIPAATIRAIRAAKARGSRVVAVGTTVTRALEGAVHDVGEVAFYRAGDGEAPLEGTTSFLLGADTRPRVVTALLTGMHEPTASHYHLLGALVPPELLARANEHAERERYLAHEFGDSTLVLS